MYILGITGNLGSGKTTVAQMLKRKGARVLDADKIAHQALAAGGACESNVLRSFGKPILKKGRINRKALAQIVFNNSKDLRKLCGMIHPVVIKEIKDEIRQYRLKAYKGFLVIDAPLLFEVGLHKLCDSVVVVRSNLGVQIKRVQKKSQLTKAEILKRIKAQMPIQQKVARADFVINNQENINHTKKQVEELWQELKKTRK
jgi:dephospho-CoA kinase